MLSGGECCVGCIGQAKILPTGAHLGCATWRTGDRIPMVAVGPGLGLRLLNGTGEEV